MAELQIKNALIKTIIFDFDGTLAKLNIDFDQMREDIFELISSYGLSEKDRQGQYVLETISFVNEILMVKSPHKAEAFTQKAYEIIEQIELAAARRGELFPWTKDLLQQLCCHDISIGIITRNCTAAVHTLFPDILSYCPVVVCREAVKNVKPHIEHLNKALLLLSSRAGNALMIGDHPLDIKAGKAAETSTAGVLTGRSSKEDFLQAGADLVLSQASDILNIII